MLRCATEYAIRRQIPAAASTSARSPNADVSAVPRYFGRSLDTMRCFNDTPIDIRWERTEAAELLRGTLDLVVLKALVWVLAIHKVLHTT